jgi:hypothetical protein
MSGKMTRGGGLTPDNSTRSWGGNANANRTRQQDVQATGRAVQVPTQRVPASTPTTQVQRSGVAANRDFGGDGVPLGGSGK